MKNEQKTKKKTSFLPTFITVGVLAVATLVSYLVFGDVTILRDSLVATAGIGGAVACAQGGVLLAHKLSNKSTANKSNSRTRNRSRNKNLNEEMIPVETVTKTLDSKNLYSASNSTNTVERKNGR